METIPVRGDPPAIEEPLARNLGTTMSPDKEITQRLVAKQVKEAGPLNKIRIPPFPLQQEVRNRQMQSSS